MVFDILLICVSLGRKMHACMNVAMSAPAACGETFPELR